MTNKVRPEGKLKEALDLKKSKDFIIPIAQKVMLDNSGPDPDRRIDVIHPSEMAKADWCIRATVMRILGDLRPEEEFSPFLENIWEEGNFIHLKWQNWLAQSGRLFGNWKCIRCGTKMYGVTHDAIAEYGICCWDSEKHTAPHHSWQYAEFNMSHGLVHGQVDGIIDNHIVEFKSVGMGTLRIDAPKLMKENYHKDLKLYDINAIWRGIKRPLPSHSRQGLTYLWLAEMNGLPYDLATFVYEFKPNQQVKEFTVKQNKRILKPLLDKVHKIEDGVASGKAPACEFGGCKYCDPATEAKSEDRPVIRRRAKSGGSGSSRAPIRRNPKSAGRSDRARRQASDAPDEQAGKLGRISRRPANSGSD